MMYLCSFEGSSETFLLVTEGSSGGDVLTWPHGGLVALMADKLAG